MPGLDGKGPEGKGSMTGRGLGRCKDGEFKSPPRGGRGLCRGFVRGMGRGPGRGFGRFGLATDQANPEEKSKSE